MISLSVDGKRVEVSAGATVLDAARAAGVYVPTLCSHPDLSPSKGKAAAAFVYRGSTKVELPPSAVGKEFEGCKLCLVEVQGKPDLVTACNTVAEAGMVILTEQPRISEARQRNLAPILAKHPHACLTCAQREGCSRTQCSSNVPIDERCCPKLGNCELQRVADYIGIRGDTPRYVPRKIPRVDSDPLFIRDPNLCISCTRCVRACEDLRDVRAIAFTFDGNEFVVGTAVGPTLAESACRFCGACVEVCPTGALVDRDLKLADKEKELVPCKYACPAGMDVPKIMRLAAAGKFGEASAVVREKAPFPLTLGAICFHPCELSCRRGKVNEPIAICDIKRFAAENDAGEWVARFKRAPPTGTKVAVVGSGPAGLTAGYYLSMLGHSVTVFDSNVKPGGTLRAAIPRYRLPSNVVDRDLDGVMESGLEFKGGVKVGQSVLIKDLRSQGYDAIFVAGGATLSKRIPLEGSELPGVLWGLDFLQEVRAGKPVRISERLVVIGGGNVAMDVALTALRLGARDIEVACLESRKEMPAFEWEIQEAMDEGIKIHCSWGPKRILSDGGKVTGIELKKCTSVFDEQKRFNPKYDESVITKLEGDTVILAIGQGSDTAYLAGLEGLNTTRGGNIIVEPATLASSIDGIYAGGDLVTGPKSVIEAVEMGRRAASSIDKKLGGKGVIEIKLAEPDTPNPRIGRIEGFPAMKRPVMPSIEREQRRLSFDRVELGYGREEAVYEAGRCLKCDLRLTIRSPPSPPEKWLEFSEANVAKVPEIDGVFQLFDEKREVIKIAGAANMRALLKEQLASNKKAKYFVFEEDKMYTKRETELLQQYMQKYGKMPGGGDELDELF